MKKLIIFVCNGNIERSVVAAECLQNTLREKRIDSKFSVDSFGLQGTKGTALPKHRKLSEYPKEWRASKPILEKLKVNISGHSFQKITPIVAKKASVIIAMDKNIYSDSKNSLLKQFPAMKNKIHIFSELTKSQHDIKDPVNSGSAKIHGTVIKNICAAIKKNQKTILKWTNTA